MSTKERYSQAELRKANPMFSRVRSTIETAFYGNNVHEVTSVAEAYNLAKKQPGVIVTDLPILHTAELGLPKGATQLVYNHGKILGRTASARHFVDDPDEDAEALAGNLREDIYAGHEQKYLKATVLVGLDPSFTVKAHVMMPEDQAFNLLSYILNFHFFDDEAEKMYKESKFYNEPDIYFYFDPNVTDPDYPKGLGVFDAPHNCAAVFSLRYFGELKKGTLTLAWAMAHRNGYTACHGGEKSFHFTDKPDKVFAFYGLSGSGKSTLTHATHGGKYDITVLHDDAFIISRENGSSVALEPSYFDKTHDYPAGHHETKYYTTVMNCDVTLDEDGKKVLVTEDLRNNNGRVIKTRYTSANRVDYEENPITALFWIMKDGSLPPLLKIDDPTLATTMGLTLATKRTSAENLPEGFDMNTLVIEPFADPFRAYPVSGDYADFKELFEKRGAKCYVLNTDAFMGKDIPKELTMDLVEKLANTDGEWKPFGNFKGVSYMPIDGYEVHLDDPAYQETLVKRMQDRLNWLNSYDQEHPKTPIQAEAKETLEGIIKELS
ncbi:phosphoenolpyruvate carboxykinase (ATP) [Lactobacillus corticis]|uniref:phosphoenolpyruvate carboxykinase (ATP) n=1 Tax=Lactobacillus corticis TaxID=2201249 RepID=A0A916QJE5_9LACO|nr:phosphoenolpyruvate carboxykinase (ATP) [Lactobacillus corticis]GFZ26365.1 phosphoenolpyruvate carboxykinase [Lactobacillus corticis]